MTGATVASQLAPVACRITRRRGEGASKVMRAWWKRHALNRSGYAWHAERSVEVGEKWPGDAALTGPNPHPHPKCCLKRPRACCIRAAVVQL
jgi:hypothetical protein